MAAATCSLPGQGRLTTAILAVVCTLLVIAPTAFADDTDAGTAVSVAMPLGTRVESQLNP